MIRIVDSTSEALAWLRENTPSVFTNRRNLQLDSREIRIGDVFVAVPGATADGRSFLKEVAARGAAAALIDADDWKDQPVSIPAIKIPSLRLSLGALAAEFYGDPSRQLVSVGVTGTNGKTSCSQWIAQVLTREGRRCAVIGTVGIGFVDAALAPSTLTTPDPVSLQRDVRQLLDAGAQALAMEVSSIGLDQHRVDGMRFDVALFTNLTRDHLDYHQTMERYEAAKALLFDWPSLQHAVINVDDAAGRRLLPQLQARGVRTIGYSVAGRGAVDRVDRYLEARSIEATREGLSFELVGDGKQLPITMPIVGEFNVANALGVVGVSIACGVPIASAAAALPMLVPPPGRMERVTPGDGPLVIVDYAHTPDAIEQAAKALRPMANARHGKLVIVFGAGGDRDPGKRAPMGAVAAAVADSVIVTSDNPRTEDPDTIIDQVAAGARGFGALARIVDRASAIAQAIASADAADIVLIAGKGHEDYQVVGRDRRPFSDVGEARRALLKRRERA